MGLTLSLVEGQPPGTQGHAQIVAWPLHNRMYPAGSPIPFAQGTWLGPCPAWGGLECCAWREGPGEPDPHCTAAEAALTA